MISISSNKTLDIILPNTNKALAEVIKDATPKQLEVIGKNKDLKSIINSLLKESSKTSMPDKALLQLVKNNPTLKDLGNVSTTIKELVVSMKENTQAKQTPTDTKVVATLKEQNTPATLKPNDSNLKPTQLPLDTKTIPHVTGEKNPLPIEKLLKEFLIDIKNLNETALKSKITNSGVFLESKLKDAQNPQVELRDTLRSLLNNVTKSSIYPVKSLQKHIQILLESDIVKNASNNALTQNLPDDKKALTQLVKGIEKIIQTLHSNIKEGDSTTTKTFNALLQKLEMQIEPKHLPIPVKNDTKNVTSIVSHVQEDSIAKLKPSVSDNINLLSLKETLLQIMPHVERSSLSEAKGLFDSLNKILKILPDTDTAATQLTDKKIPQELRSAIEPLKTTMGKADHLFSKDIGILLDKLASLNSLQKLSTQQNIKEIISNDLKSVLLRAGEEIAKSSHPNQAEILRHIDKLSLQIDYYQLVSHLSNSSSIYLPFSWDTLEEGQINLKKTEDDKFYCDIELKLKEYGELNLRLVLYEKNQIKLQIHSDNDDLKNIIKENIASLRSALIESQIIPTEIRIKDSLKKSTASAYEDYTDKFATGFEVKG